MSEAVPAPISNTALETLTEKEVSPAGSNESEVDDGEKTAIGSLRAQTTRENVLETVKVPRTDVFREDEKLRERWWVATLSLNLYLPTQDRYQLWRFKRAAPSPPASFADSPMLQLAYCNLWTFITFGWCYDVMKIGYQRPLQPTDLRKVDRKCFPGDSLIYS